VVDEPQAEIGGRALDQRLRPRQRLADPDVVSVGVLDAELPEPVRRWPSYPDLHQSPRKHVLDHRPASACG
jgi:hypothetical protein